MSRLARRHDADTAPQKRRYERFMELAREASRRGDQVQMKSYYQNAEHALRTMRYPDQS